MRSLEEQRWVDENANKVRHIKIDDIKCSTNVYGFPCLIVEATLVETENEISFEINP